MTSFRVDRPGVDNLFDRAIVKASTATVATTTTITAAQVRAFAASGIMIGTLSGAQTITFPTAALMVAAFPGVDVNDLLVLRVMNGADNTLTLASGSGGTDVGTLTVGAGIISTFVVRFTNVTAASEAYSLILQI